MSPAGLVCCQSHSSSIQSEGLECFYLREAWWPSVSHSQSKNELQIRDQFLWSDLQFFKKLNQNTWHIQGVNIILFIFYSDVYEVNENHDVLSLVPPRRSFAFRFRWLRKWMPQSIVSIYRREHVNLCQPFVDKCCTKSHRCVDIGWSMQTPPFHTDVTKSYLICI